MHSAEHILGILDACCDAFTFPMLDNGYVYLAATRLSLHRSERDWALVIEVFGYSPRAFDPSVAVYTFSGAVYSRPGPEDFVSQAAFETYLAVNPHNELAFYYPISPEGWRDPEDSDYTLAAGELALRGERRVLPGAEEYAARGIALEEPGRPQVFELCRYLAGDARELVLATVDERRAHVAPDLQQILLLDEWRHPAVGEERTTDCETFRQLAAVLETGDVGCYRPTESPNTHFSHWPGGGTL